MGGRRCLSFALLPCLSIVIQVLLICSGSYGLQVGFYDQTCRRVETVVSTGVFAAAAVDSEVPPKLLRLLFHDCFIEGCDASVLLDSGPNGGLPEKKDPANLSLGGFGVIDNIKRILEILCPGVVSCADILALAAREAVVRMGGPRVEIPTGRLDGFVSDASKVRSNLPDTTFSVDQLKQFFSAKGLSEVDIVTLSGAHTIGRAHCTAFNDRFKAGTNGTSEVTDNSIDPGFAQQLLQECPIVNPSPSTVLPNDPVTPTAFDNTYYANVKQGRGLFHSDAALLLQKSTATIVDEFAQSQSRFFAQWQESFIKLSSVGIKSGSKGEIRNVCNQINRS